MFDIYTQLIISSKYPFNNNIKIPYFIILISNGVNFAICGSISLA